jgi:hypothetical protein
VTQPLNAISPIDQKFFELIVPIATFLTGTLSGIMLAGAKKEDQEAMLAAQKLANENFEATKKAMVAPPPPPQPTVTVTDRGITIGAPMGGVTQAPGQVVVGYGGKMAPPSTIHPEI